MICQADREGIEERFDCVPPPGGVEQQKLGPDHLEEGLVPHPLLVSPHIVPANLSDRATAPPDIFIPIVVVAILLTSIGVTEGGRFMFFIDASESVFRCIREF